MENKLQYKLERFVARLRIDGIQEHIFTVDNRCLKGWTKLCSKGKFISSYFRDKVAQRKELHSESQTSLSAPPLSSCKILVTVVSSTCILRGIIKPISYFLLRIKQHNVHTVTDFQKVLWVLFLKITFKNKWWESVYSKN